MVRKTSKERLIERLNKGFNLNINPDHLIKAHGNPKGYFDVWSWCFIGPVFGQNFGGTVGSYESIGHLLKAKALVIGRSEFDGEWSVIDREDYNKLNSNNKLFSTPIFENANN